MEADNASWTDARLMLVNGLGALNGLLLVILSEGHFPLLSCCGHATQIILEIGEK